MIHLGEVSSLLSCCASGSIADHYLMIMVRKYILGFCLYEHKFKEKISVRTIHTMFVAALYWYCDWYKKQVHFFARILV